MKISTDLPIEKNLGDAMCLLFTFSEAISMQRDALARRDWVKLQQSIQALQQAMHQIASFPGGPEGMRSQLNASAGDTREAADLLIQKVVIDRRSSAELIRLQLQRLQALQLMTSLESDDGTYTESGNNKGRSGRLSTWV